MKTTLHGQRDSLCSQARPCLCLGGHQPVGASLAPVDLSCAPSDATSWALPSGCQQPLLSTALCLRCQTSSGKNPP